MADAIASLPHHPSVEIGCPCLRTLEAYQINASGAPLRVVIGGAVYNYSSRFGQGACAAYDFDMQPSCSAASSCHVADAPPAWCSSRWCYVNGSACSVGSAPTGSGGFLITGLVDPNRTLHYSYAACGACDSYTPLPVPSVYRDRDGGFKLAVYVALFVLLCCILIWFRYHRYTWRRLMSDAAGARLNYVQNERMAIPQCIPEDGFHVFLSHVRMRDRTRPYTHPHTHPHIH